MIMVVPKLLDKPVTRGFIHFLGCSAERSNLMTAQRNPSAQAMTTEDRQFDALLRQAAQFQEAAASPQRQSNMLSKATMAPRQTEALPRT
jgi:hypothetical protein